MKVTTTKTPMIKFRLNDPDASDYEIRQKWEGIGLCVSFVIGTFALSLLAGTIKCFYMIMGMMAIMSTAVLLSCAFDRNVPDSERREYRKGLLLYFFVYIGVILIVSFLMSLIFPIIYSLHISGALQVKF